MDTATPSHSTALEQDATPPQPRPFSHKFCDKDFAPSRRIYIKAIILGCCLVIFSVWAVFPIYWGSLWRTPQRKLKGWVVDFDGGVIGHSVVNDLTGPSSAALPLGVSFKAVNASQFPGGVEDMRNAVVEQHTWVAVTINPGASDRLQASVASPNATYNGSEAMTFWAAEARNENAYRVITRPSVEASLNIICGTFAMSAIQLFAASTPNATALIATSPQTIVQPLFYGVENVAPFNEPVASAVTFVGLIYSLILSFFVVMICYGAREGSGINRNLTLRSLIITRFVTFFIAIFFVSLFYSLVTLAFRLDFTREFGKGGFVIFWMLNWVGMLSVGLAIEALITLFTSKFIPFFMLLWIIVNVSVCSQPIEVLPYIFRYGYAIPFYNISHSVRCIVFGTKNQIGQNFGILIAWGAISCITLPLVQWYVRRGDVIAEKQAQERHQGRKSSVYSSEQDREKQPMSPQQQQQEQHTGKPPEMPENSAGSSSDGAGTESTTV